MANFFASLFDRTTPPANGPFQRALADEKAQIDRAARGSQACEPPAPQTHARETDSAVWKIHVPNQPPRFMRLDHVPANSDRHVVMVDADRFYRAWLNRAAEVDNHLRTDECVLRADMTRDYKYSGAVEGFDPQARTAVPLAWCHCRLGSDGQPRISFTNGVTRTFWLLANHAESFPVLVSGADEAQELHRVAGVGPGPQRAAEVYAQSQQAADRQAAAKPEPGHHAPPGVVTPLDRGPRPRGPRGM